MRPEPRPLPDLLDSLPTLESEAWADPSPRNVMGFADALRLAGRPERAIEVLFPLLTEDAAAISPRVLLAWCLLDVGREVEANAALDTVRALDPANPFGRVGPSRRALAVAARADAPASASAPAPVTSGEAEAEPERSLTPEELSRIPPSPLYSATLADIFERQGFEEKAIQIYEQVVRAHPDRLDLKEKIEALRARTRPGNS